MPSKSKPISPATIHHYLTLLRAEAAATHEGIVSSPSTGNSSDKHILPNLTSTKESSKDCNKSASVAPISMQRENKQAWIKKTRNSLLHDKRENQQVLVFNNDHTRGKGIRDAFVNAGYSVLLAEDYEAADGYCHSVEQFHLLVFNLAGPKFPAIQLLQQIQPPKVPVILTTWEVQPIIEEHIATCQLLGASCCFRNLTSYEKVTSRAEQLISRYSKLQQVFVDMAKYSDPDYAANKAKERVRMVETNTGFHLGRVVKRSTLDEHGVNMNMAKSRLLMAINRSRQGVQAAARVRTIAQCADPNDTNSGLCRFEKRFSITALRPKRGCAKFPDDGPSLPLTKLLTDPLRFVELPWEDIPDEYLERLGFPRDVCNPTIPELLQARMREVVPVQGKSSSEHKFLIQGLKLRQSGNMNGAILQYNRAVQGNSSFWPLFLCRGVAYHFAGKPKQAFIDFSRCIALQPKCADAYYNRGLLRYTVKDSEGAISDMNAALAISPHDAQILSCRGYIHRRKSCFMEAKSDYIERNNILEEQFESKSRGSQRKPRSRISATWKGDDNVAMRRRRKASDSDSYESSEDSMSVPSGYESTDSEGDGSSVDSALSGSMSVWDEHEDNTGQNLLKGRLTKERHGRVDLEEYRNANNLGENVFAQIFQQKSPLEAAFGKSKGKRKRKDLEEISRLLRTIPIFQRMPNTMVRKVAEVAHSHTCLKGMCIMQQGAAANSFFVIISGRVDVMCRVPGSDSEQFITSMTAGSYFGETALLNNSSRKASVICAENSFVVYVSKKDFLNLNLVEYLEREVAEKKALLHRIGLFEDLTEKELHEMSKVACYKTFERNSVILRQGDVPKHFVVLISGLCKVLQFSDTVADLGRREMELLEDLNRFDMAYVYHHCLHDDDIREAAARTQSADERLLRSSEFQVGVSPRPSHSNRPRKERAGPILKKKLEAELADVRKRLLQLRKQHHSSSTNVVSKLVEVGTAYPPNVFGEVAVLDPFKGRERGTVIAQSYVKVIIINKGQIDSFQNNSKFLERVRSKSFNYFSHLEVKRELQEQQAWKMYRIKTTRQIEKSRWPIPQTRIRHLTTGSGDTEVIPESEMPGMRKAL